MTVTIGLLHPGAMGAAVARQLRSPETRLLWCPDGRSPATIARAKAAGLEPAALPELASSSDVVLSLVPPALAEETALSMLAHAFSGLYVEANAIRPQRVGLIQAAMRRSGVRVVDACIIGPPPPGGDLDPQAPRLAVPTRLFLAGDHQDCSWLARLFLSGALSVHYLGTQVGRASGLKIAQSTIQKLSRVVAAVGHALAMDYGVGAELVEVVQPWPHPAADPSLFPDLAARAWRWKPELLDAAQALLDAGLPPEPASAIAAVLTRWEHFKDTPSGDIHTVLSALHEPDDSARPCDSV